MHIAYVCTDAGVPVFGSKGCSVHVQEVLRALNQEGAQCQVFASNTRDTPPADLAHIPVHTLDRPAGERARREQAALGANPGWQRQLQQQGPFDMVYERYALWSYGAMEYAQAQGIPGLLEVNTPLIEEQAQHRGLIDRDGAEASSLRAFNAADDLLAVSREIAQYLQQTSGRQNIHLLSNGVNTERFNPAVTPALKQDPGSFTVGFLGTFKPWHGVPDLVDAFALLHREVAHSRLLLVGDGPERTNIERRLQDYGLLTQCHFTGAALPSQVPALLTAMDVAVAPYPALDEFYFSPLKVFEYMAAGCAVLASRIGQLADIIQHPVDGLLYSPGDIQGMAKLLLALEQDPGQRVLLGRAARSKVVQTHSWQSVAQRILTIAEARSQRNNAQGVTP